MPGVPVARRRNSCWFTLKEVKAIGESLPTITENEVLLLWLGEPSSVTSTVTAYIRSACPAVGFHVNTPVDGSMVAPMGALGPRVKVSLLGGSSGSEALFVIVSNDPGRIICGGTGAMSGALFTSLTIMLKLLMSLKAGTALSVTCTVIRFVLGP